MTWNTWICTHFYWYTLRPAWSTWNSFMHAVICGQFDCYRRRGILTLWAVLKRVMWNDDTADQPDQRISYCEVQTSTTETWAASVRGRVHSQVSVCLLAPGEALRPRHAGAGRLPRQTRRPPVEQHVGGARLRVAAQRCRCCWPRSSNWRSVCLSCGRVNTASCLPVVFERRCCAVLRCLLLESSKYSLIQYSLRIFNHFTRADLAGEGLWPSLSWA